MKFLALYRPETGEEGGRPDPEHMAQMGKLVETSMANGSLLATEPLAPRAAGARVRLSSGKFTVTGEADRISGYAFLNAASKEEAVEFCKTFLQAAGDGVCEIRQVLEFGPPPQS